MELQQIEIDYREPCLFWVNDTAFYYLNIHYDLEKKSFGKNI